MVKLHREFIDDPIGYHRAVQRGELSDVSEPVKAKGSINCFDEPAAEQFGRFKAILRRAGRPIGDIDLFIAGVAVRYGLTVVTNNTDHFARLPDLPLENWLETPRQSS